jgi:myo-inositol 2-dehydrogenase/D-chiro-inositol 1-dehydrogenase
MNDCKVISDASLQRKLITFLKLATHHATCSKTKPFPSLEEAIIELGQSLDGIIVSSPTYTHEAVITEASSYGVSVFTEKPVDETAGKIEKLFGIAESAGISLCCSFQRRFDPSYQAMVEAVRQGQVGTPVAANIFFADHPCPPKEFLFTGGNIFMDLSAHDVDFITHTLEDEVATVYATGTSSSEDLAAAGVHDNATMVIKFQRGENETRKLILAQTRMSASEQTRCRCRGDTFHEPISHIWL